jgi:hypothetical protein
MGYTQSSTHLTVREVSYEAQKICQGLLAHEITQDSFLYVSVVDCMAWEIRKPSAFLAPIRVALV